MGFGEIRPKRRVFKEGFYGADLGSALQQSFWASLYKEQHFHLPARPCGEPTGVEGFDEKLLLE